VEKGEPGEIFLQPIFS